MLSKDKLINHSKQEFIIFENNEIAYLSVVQNELYLMSRYNNISKVIEISRFNDNDLYIFIETGNHLYEIKFKYVKEGIFSCIVNQINDNIIKRHECLEHIKKINFDLIENIKENEKTIKLF